MVGHRASRRVFLLSLLALSASARAQDGVRSLGAAASIGTADSIGAADSVDVLVATRRLARGAVLRASDMTVARIGRRALAARSAARSATRSAGAVTAGWVARRVIQAGEVLRAPAVAPAPLVAAGQAVQYTYQQDGLALTLDGVAPVAGSLGDTIPVRLGARRRVTGIVAGPAHVVALAPSQVP